MRLSGFLSLRLKCSGVVIVEMVIESNILVDNSTIEKVLMNSVLNEKERFAINLRDSVIQ